MISTRFSRPADRSVVGTHGGSPCSVYRALAVSVRRTLGPIRRPRAVSPIPTLLKRSGRFPQRRPTPQQDRSHARSMRGHLAAGKLRRARIAREHRRSVRVLAITRTRLHDLPELRSRDPKPDGSSTGWRGRDTESGGVSVVKIAIRSRSGYLPRPGRATSPPPRTMLHGNCSEQTAGMCSGTA